MSSNLSTWSAQGYHTSERSMWRNSVPFTTNKSPKYRKGTRSKCKSFESIEDPSTTEVCCSTSARSGINSEWKKTVIFWLPTWQPCTQEPQNGNSLFLCKPKGRHVHKSTNNTCLGQEYREDKPVDFLPLLLHSRFQYLSYSIWCLRHSGDYFLGLRMNCSYFYKLSLNMQCWAL